MIISTVTLDDLSFLVKILNPVHSDWDQFGIALEVSPATLDTIKKEGSNIDLKSCMEKGLKAWFQMKVKGHTWKCVCEALKEHGYNKLANDLRHKYKKELEGECYNYNNPGFG